LNKRTYLKRPDRAGWWIWKSRAKSKWWLRVEVEENCSSGRLCKQLAMGGSSQCGFADWTGAWSFSEKA
jgi:hypothetical protein